MNCLAAHPKRQRFWHSFYIAIRERRTVEEPQNVPPANQAKRAHVPMKSDVVELLKEVALTRSQKAFQTLGVVDITNFKYAMMTDVEKMDMTIIQQGIFQEALGVWVQRTRPQFGRL